MEQRGISKFLVITLVVVLTTIVVGGSVYYVQDKQNTKTKNDLQTEIDTLNAQLRSAQKAASNTAATLSTSSTTSTSPATTASPSPATTATTSPDPASGWKSFTDVTTGLSLKYPTDYSTTDIFNVDKLVVVLVTREKLTAMQNNTATEILPNFRIVYYSSAKDLTDNDGKITNSTSLISYLQNYKSTEGPVFNYTPKKLGQIDGYKVEMPNIGGMGFYMFEHGGKVYEISYDDIDTNIDKIIATITFN